MFRPNQDKSSQLLTCSKENNHREGEGNGQAPPPLALVRGRQAQHTRGLMHIPGPTMIMGNYSHLAVKVVSFFFASLIGHPLYIGPVASLSQWLRQKKSPNCFFFLPKWCKLPKVTKVRNGTWESAFSSLPRRNTQMPSGHGKKGHPFFGKA